MSALDLPALTNTQKVGVLVELAVVANDTGIETLLQIVTEKVDNKFTDALDDVEVLSLGMFGDQGQATGTPVH